MACGSDLLRVDTRPIGVALRHRTLGVALLTMAFGPKQVFGLAKLCGHRGMPVGVGYLQWAVAPLVAQGESCRGSQEQTRRLVTP